MQFLEEFIPKILSGEKTQTRRLVKEYDYCNKGCTQVSNSAMKHFIRYDIGKSYAVCPGRGKGTVGKCDSCGALSYWVKHKGKQFPQQIFLTAKKCSMLCSWNPLRIRIKAIRKEKLLDITEADARKEGCRDRHEFICTFYKINHYTKMPKGFKLLKRIKEKDIFDWNPDVWVLEFEVEK